MINKLHNTRQQDHVRWCQFIEEIDRTLEKLNVIQNLSLQDYNKRREEFIKTGLHKETSYYLFSEGVVELEKLMEEIEELEDLIINNESLNSHWESEQLTDGTPDFTKKDKYCSYHKSRTHDTDECYKIKGRSKEDKKVNKRSCNYSKSRSHTTEECYRFRNKTPRDRESGKKICAIREVRSAQGLLELSGFIGNVGCPARILLDTGAELNYVTSEAVKQYNLKTEEAKRKTVELADGRELTTNQQTKFKVYFKAASQEGLDVHAHVLGSKRDARIILGNDFLTILLLLLQLKL